MAAGVRSSPRHQWTEIYLKDAKSHIQNAVHSSNVCEPACTPKDVASSIAAAGLDA